MVLGGAVVVLAAGFASPGQAEERNRQFYDPYSIMVPEKPEPWLPPKYKSPRGLPQRPQPARPTPAPPSVVIGKPPPPIVLPNGQVVPSTAPVLQGNGSATPTENFGSAVARCAHQATAAGVPANQRSIYMNQCTSGR